jgi:hypothetical protein
MKSAIGIVAFIAGLAALAGFAYGIFLVAQIGTCAAGVTPYVIARPCPPGTDSIIWLITAGLIVGIVCMVATGATLGARAATVLWAALFVPVGVVFFVIAHGNPQVAVVFYILSVMFVVMGATPLVVSTTVLASWNI